MAVTITIECPRAPRRPPILVESVLSAGVAEPAGRRIDANAAGIRPGPGSRLAPAVGSLTGALGWASAEELVPGLGPAALGRLARTATRAAVQLAVTADAPSGPTQTPGPHQTDGAASHDSTTNHDDPQAGPPRSGQERVA